MAVMAIFILLAMASKVNKIHYGAFNYSNQVEDRQDKGTYVLMEDGTRVNGSKVRWKSGLFSKDVIKIDDQEFKIRDVRGYRDGNTYYGKLNKTFIKRIVHGKLNVYVHMYDVTTTSTSRNGMMSSRTYTRTDQYVQHGEHGEMIGIAGQKDILKHVGDCPLSVQMIDLKSSKLRKAIRRDPNYMNKVFEVYNNDCKPVDGR